MVEGESGTAHIVLAEEDNSIIVVQGANAHLTLEVVRKAEGLIADTTLVLIQQEIPEETVAYVSKICQHHGIPLMLNPAPAREVDKEIIDAVAYLTPNEHEASILFSGIEAKDALKAYPHKLFITEGKRGVRYFDGEQEVGVPTYPVQVVDTTGAGDTFNAAFAVALSEGKTTKESLGFANRAASISVTKFGAEGGMPTREEVERALQQK